MQRAVLCAQAQGGGPQPDLAFDQKVDLDQLNPAALANDPDGAGQRLERDGSENIERDPGHLHRRGAWHPVQDMSDQPAQRDAAVGLPVPGTRAGSGRNKAILLTDEERVQGAGVMRGARLVADRQILHPADKGRLDRARGPGQFDIVDPREEFAHERGELHLGEMLAKAQVRPGAESKVAVGLAVDPERERIVEHVLVAVGRGVGEDHDVACADLLALDLDVLGGGPA